LKISDLAILEMSLPGKTQDLSTRYRYAKYLPSIFARSEAGDIMFQADCSNDDVTRGKVLLKTKFLPARILRLREKSRDNPRDRKILGNTFPNTLEGYFKELRVQSQLNPNRRSNSDQRITFLVSIEESVRRMRLASETSPDSLNTYVFTTARIPVTRINPALWPANLANYNFDTRRAN